MTRISADILITLSLLVGAVSAVDAQTISFVGSAYPVISETAEPATGLNCGIHVVYSVKDISIHYRPASEGDVEWYRFGNNGTANAVPVESAYEHGEWILRNVAGDCGYMIMDDNRSFCFWVTDYSAHMFSVNAFSVSDDSDCRRTMLDFSGSASPIRYYGTNGRMYSLSRDISIGYRSLSFDAALHNYTISDISRLFPSVDRYVSVDAPLCDTQFSLRGDRFLAYWDKAVEITTPTYRTKAVEAHVTVEQMDNVTANQKPAAVESVLGGSAPVNVHFFAAVSDKAAFTEWQFAGDDEFTDVDLRFSELEFDYTFRESGTTYIRFIAADASGDCNYESEVYAVSIGESALECPNAFSPYNADGVNDEWKVSYRSLVSFECHIFNRWGEEITAFHDASSGWDGRYKGKLVPPGVYYYVIIAEGADGKKYRRSGDINIMGTTR